MKTGLAIIIVLVILVVLVAGYPPFRERKSLKSSWEPAGTGTKLNMVAAAVVQDDTTGKELVFVGGGVGQEFDAVFGLVNGKLEIVAQLPKPVDDATTCAVACALLPGSSPQSLLIGRLPGVYFFPMIDGAWGSSVTILWSRPATGGQVPGSVSVADTTGDGLLDVYIGMYQSMDKFEAFRFSAENTERSVFLSQEWGYSSNDQVVQYPITTFVDRTAFQGLAGDRNTWTASFVDLDNSGFPDLVVAADEGPPVIYRNNGGTFSRDTTPLPTGFWMGMAIGDFTGSGYPSIFLSNTGKGVPAMLMKMMGFDPTVPGAAGLTSDHLLLANDGGRLQPVSAASGIGLSWGATAVPRATPGIAVAQNWPMIPWHRARVSSRRCRRRGYPDWGV